MAPIAMDSLMSWVSSPEVAVISSVAFLVLSITLLALCTNCNRWFWMKGVAGLWRKRHGGGNRAKRVGLGATIVLIGSVGSSGYDVNSSMSKRRTNGSTKSGGEQDLEVTTGWRTHTLPPNTLESFQTPANEPATVSTGQ